MRRCLVLTLLTLIGLVGCSSTKMAYQYADWGIVWWVNDFVPMTTAQENQLERDIASLQQWHCTEELPRYSQWLVTLKQDVRSRQFDQATVEHHQQALFSFFPPLMERAKPAAVNLLSSLSDEQVRELAANMEENQREKEEEFLSDNPEETREARAERTAERVERWLGSLTDSQMETVYQWSDARGQQTVIWLEGRRNWQKALMDALEQRQQPDFDDRISYLIDNNTEVRGEQYQRMLDESRTAMASLMSRLLEQASDEQLEHLIDRAASLRSDFDTLHASTCTAEGASEQQAG